MIAQQNQIVQIINLIPIPWKAFIIYLLIYFIWYFIIKIVLFLLLYIEFVITQQLRLHKKKPLPGTFFFDQVVEFCLKLEKVLLWILFSIILLGVIIWYALPFISNQFIAQYLKSLFNWMY